MISKPPSVQPYVYVGCLVPLIAIVAAVVIVVVVLRPSSRGVVIVTRNGPTVLSTQVVPLR